MNKELINTSSEFTNPFTDSLDKLEMKQMQWSSSLTALMINLGKTRSQMAELIGWNKSRITRILGGETNPTLATVYAFSEALGFDFDIVFYNKDHPRPVQFWNKFSFISSVVDIKPVLQFVPQHKSEVASDLLNDSMSEFYIKIVVEKTPMKTIVGSVETIAIDDFSSNKTFSISSRPLSNQDYSYATR